MKGDWRGDISKDSFDPTKHFLRVLSQQGRVQLDADSNEQIDILLHYIQTLAKDIIGPFAGTEHGFEIGKLIDGTFNIGYGRYYVDGILCENEKKDSPCEKIEDISLGYDAQLDYPITTIKDVKTSIENTDLPLLVYLDVWERHISCVEDDDIREKALGGPDTATRSKVIWQVKVLKGSDICLNNGTNGISNEIECQDWLEIARQTNYPNKNKWTANVVEKCLQQPNRGCLKARAMMPKEDASSPCTISPEARYRGAENQLYRVEIHRGGIAMPSGTNKNLVAQTTSGTKDYSKCATFKWSRENSAVVFPIIDINGNELTLEHLGRDDRSSLKVDDWVEVIDDDYSLLILSRPSPLLETNNKKLRPLAQVSIVDLAEMKVTLKMKEGTWPDYNTKDKHPLLRRWDYAATEDGPELADKGASGLIVVEGVCKYDDKWLTLEDGVQICFQAPSNGQPNKYQVGDYWLIPARTETGDVEWPGTIEKPEALPPHGIEHHYAPLAIMQNGVAPIDCRPLIDNIGKCLGQSVAQKAPLM